MASMKNPLQELDHNSLILAPELSQNLDTAVKPTQDTASALPAPSTTKRKASPTPDPDDELDFEDEFEEFDDDDPRLFQYQWDCGQIRRKIRSFLKSEEMKVGEFQRAIHVSSKAYYDFMKQSGRDKGMFSFVYNNAYRFFAKRELQGIKTKKKKASVSKKAKLEENAQKYDVSGISLPGEDEVDVEVYDTCDEVRKKIRAHLRASEMSQAAFCREISKTFPDDRCLQSSSLSSFLSKSGPNKGNTSLIFYAAYVFFEKLRIRDGKPKTEFRLDMEDVWPNGFDRKTPANKGYIVHVDSFLYVDDYGRVRCQRN